MSTVNIVIGVSGSGGSVLVADATNFFVNPPMQNQATISSQLKNNPTVITVISGDYISISAYNPKAAFDHWQIVGPTAAESGSTNENPFTTNAVSNFTIKAYFKGGVSAQTILIVAAAGLGALAVIGVATSK